MTGAISALFAVQQRGADRTMRADRHDTRRGWQTEDQMHTDYVAAAGDCHRRPSAHHVSVEARRTARHALQSAIHESQTTELISVRVVRPVVIPDERAIRTARPLNDWAKESASISLICA
jgi:hypothetical protein